MDDDGLCFADYCIVCDKAIVPAKVEEKKKEPEVAKVKKVAAGAIRIKNPDGTVTTRTAAGQKTTRPLLRRGPSSTARLGAPAQRPLALTRTKTNESARRPSQERNDGPPAPTPPAIPAAPIPAPIPVEIPFISQIYCSPACAKTEADRSTDLSRRMSSDLSLNLVTSHLPVSRGSRRSLNGPSSPLYISGSSDTSSSSGETNAAQAATSAPNFFAIHRDADEAWRDVNKQRRSSVHPSFRPAATGFGMIRDRSQSSGSFTTGEPSSDSLNSDWNGSELHLGRSISGQGIKRMPPVTEHVPMTGGWPMMGFNSSKAPGSLSASYTSDRAIPAEFGSAPGHTLNLWNSYSNAFSHRESDNTVPRVSTTPTHPGMPRRTSSSTLQRPIGGTIRAKSKTDVSWDSYGLEEVNAKKRQAKVQVVESSTPRQHISIGDRGCIISYGTPVMSRRVSEASDQHPGALTIPISNRGGSTISPGRTPTIKASTPNARTHPTSSEIPDLAGLRIGAGSCNPILSTSHVGSSSGPRSTWNWNKYEKEGGKTYVVPEVMQKAGAAKPGLFFFK